MAQIAEVKDESDILPVEIEVRTILLDDPAQCHVVVAGEVSLFSTRANARVARLSLGRIGEGALLFGAPPSFLGEETLLAVGSPDARFYRLPAESWRLADPAEAFAEGLAAWLTALAQGLGEKIEPKPHPDLTLSGTGRNVQASANMVLAASISTMWVDLGDVGGELFGIEPVSGLIPLPPGAWLTITDAGCLTVLDWTEGLKRADWPEALDSFNAAAGELLPLVRGFNETDEFNRIRARNAAEALDAHHIAGRLGALLGNDLESVQETGTDGLADVLRILGREIGIRIERPVKFRRAQMDLAPALDEYARASNFRLQSIELSGEWWRFESGPLLGRRRSGEPVALVWARGYVEIDRTGKRRRVDRAIAQDILAAVDVLFRPQPARLSFVNLQLASLAGSRLDIIGLLATILASSFIAQLLPMATSLVFGVLVPAAMKDALLQIGILIVLVGVAAFLVQLAGDIARQRMNVRADASLYRETWDRIVSQPLGNLRKYASADTTARAGSALSALSGLRQFAFAAAAMVGTLVSSLFVIAWNSAPLAGAAAALFLVHITIGVLAGWLQARAYASGDQLMGTADNHMLQIVSGITKLRTAAAEDRAIMRWADRFAAMRAKLVGARRVMNLYESWLAAFPILGSAVLFATIQGFTPAQEGVPPLSMASVIAVITAFGVMFVATGQFLRAVLSVWMLKPGWTFARPLLESQPEPTAGRTDPGVLSGEVEFSSVSFAYEGGTSVLEGVNFRVGAGEMIAVVGPSGSGKSTLVRLLLGLEEPNKGAIYIDGHDVRSLHAGAVRRQIGVVLQDDKLPPGTIYEIVRGVTETTYEEVWRALAAAAVAEEIAAMPLKLHTPLTDAGRALSGGQVQRIGLARAILADPPILLLDEATSALDSQTQARAMDSVMQMSATRVIIAHRISTIRHAHRIIMLDNGRIVETGTFDDLMKKNGQFARLVLAGA